EIRRRRDDQENRAFDPRAVHLLEEDVRAAGNLGLDPSRRRARLEVGVGVDDLPGVAAPGEQDDREGEGGSVAHSSTRNLTTVTPSPPSWLSPGRYILTYGESSR